MRCTGINSQDPTAVNDQLERIVVSADFKATNRNRRFLEFVVRETLAGRSELIKAYTIATCVFGRSADFDPQVDTIVRIEAGRLRRALERYYLTAGRDDPVVISIPKGSYVPTFASGESPEENVFSPVIVQACFHTKLRATILVSGFEEEGDQSGYPNLTRGFTRHVVAGLARFTELDVFGPDMSALQTGPPKQADDDIDYLVTGGTTISESRFGAEALLIDNRTGRCLWGSTFEHSAELNGLVPARDAVASAVVQALAQPYGAICVARSDAAEAEEHKAPSSYASVVLYRRYARTFDRSKQEAVRQALEATIKRDPGYAEAFACLSQVYTNIYRFQATPNLATSERAFVLANRAIELAPNSSRSHHALSRAYWFAGEMDASFQELEIARALNPHDTGILADLGQQRAVMADWEKAIPLLDEAFSRNPGLPSSYRVGFSLFHFAQGRFEEALAEARKIDVSGVIYRPMMVAVSSIRLGRDDDAARAVGNMLDIDPDYGEHAVADLARRNVEPDLATALLEALGDAGLPSGPNRRRRAAHLRSV